MRSVVLAALVACHSSDPHPVQSEAEALALVCSGHALGEVTNPELAKLAAQDSWDATMHVLQRAEAAKLSCHPRIATRGPNAELALPTLATADGTRALAPAPSVAISSAHIVFNDVGTFTASTIPADLAERFRAHAPPESGVVIAADHALLLRDLAPALDPLRGAGVNVYDLLVVAGGDLRAVRFGMFATPPSAPALSIGVSSVTLDGKQIADTELHAAAAKLQLVGIVLDPTTSVARLAQVLALVGVPAMLVPAAQEPQQTPPDLSSCAPLEIRFDGKPLEPKSSLARGHDRSGGIEVVLSNKPLTCADLLKEARPVANDEITTEVIVKRDPQAIALVQAVFDNDIQDSSSRLLKSPPSKAGDTVDVCIARATLHGHFSHQGHELAVAGLAHATYCGELP